MGEPRSKKQHKTVKAAPEKGETNWSQNPRIVIGLAVLLIVVMVGGFAWLQINQTRQKQLFLGMVTENRIRYYAPSAKLPTPMATATANAGTVVYPDPAKKEAGELWYPSLGEENAPVTIIEYSNFLCSHCRDFNLNYLENLLRDYVVTGKVRYVAHPYAFSTQPEAVKAAQAALCAAEQGHYFDFEHSYFRITTVEEANINKAATLANLDMEKFSACVEENRYGPALDEAIADADAQGINSTPTFIVNGKVVVGFDQATLEQAIKDALAQGQ
jgi:protein-disulfide isomerase